jgi:hypothetical protein
MGKFAALFGAKYPKALAKVVDDRDTSNPDRVHLRHVRRAYQGHEGPGSRAAGLAMVFKLLQAPEKHWRYVNDAHLVALVRAPSQVSNGVLGERPQQAAQEFAA